MRELIKAYHANLTTLPGQHIRIAGDVVKEPLRLASKNPMTLRSQQRNRTANA